MTRIHRKTLADAGRSAPPKTHPAFEFVRAVPIESLRLTVEEYRHRRTGAAHYHLAADNPENVFLVALRTVPMDSTGVAHILEHTALCGSERFPVRDPFFMMIRRSLNTFINAFTSSDWTAYPFASQNRKDFSNLLEVYLDAVFFSRLHELDFAQEGHRIEFEQPDNPDSPLVYKGVVFNEMKGAMSSPTSALWQALTRELFPTTTYHYNSGGEPEDIPNLGYEQLRAFYRVHYHPSNAVFMTYGDIPAYEHHEQFETRALSRFERLDRIIEVTDEQRLAAPKAVEDVYALDDEAGAENGKTHIVLGWLLGQSTNAMDLMKAHLMSSVLLDNGASPLRHALETTDLGAAPSPLCGMEESNREMAFMCGLEGSTPENAEAFERLALGVLADVARDGVPQDRVEAVLHQLELSQREIKGDGYPFGLQLILEALPPAVHRGDPVSLLDLDPVLNALREAIKDPAFIKDMVREQLLDNPHRVRLILKPDAELALRREAAEKARLARIKASLHPGDAQRIVAQAEALTKRQAQEDDPEILPKVGLDDVPAELAIPEGVSLQSGGSPVAWFARGTNGIVYEQIVIDLPALDDDLVEVLPYYTRCLTELGSGGRDYMETQALQDAVTGGIHASTSLRGAIDDVQSLGGHFVLSGKALARNRQELTGLMHETLETARFDEADRIRELIAQDRARAEQSITGNGHSLAMLAASSGMSPAAALNHRLRGLAGVSSLKKLDDGLDEPASRDGLVDRFRRIHERMINAPRQYLLVADEEQRQPLLDTLAAQPGTITGAGHVPFAQPAVRASVHQLWTTSTQVNFCAKAYPTVPAGHADAAALVVLGGFLRNGYLHRAIREQGGAYGGGAGQESDIAAFRFYSYRDPRMTETLADFDRAIDWLLSGRHEWRQVEESILGVIGSIDKPGSPAGDAMKAFHNGLYGRTPAQRRAFRERVLAVTLDDLRRVGETYLRPESASIAIITSQRHQDAAASLGLDAYHV